MKKSKKLLILPLMFALLSTNVVLQAETEAYANEVAIGKEELFPDVLADKAKNAFAFVTKEELATALVHCLEEPLQSENFANLKILDKASVTPALRGYFAAAEKLQLLNLEPALGEGLSSPKLELDKQTAATMIGKALGLRSDAPTGFNDEESIADWALPYVSGLKTADLLWPSLQDFLPTDKLTWEELRACLQKAKDTNKFVQPSIKVLVESREEKEADKRIALSKPMGLSRDEAGTMYIADSGNSLITAVDIKGSVKTFSGKNSPQNIYQLAVGGYEDGALLQAAYSRPTDVYMTKEGLLVADMGNNAIRLLSGGKAYTFAGNKRAGHLDGNRKNALFNGPSALVLDEAGNMYISDTLNHCIRKIDEKGIVTTIAGTAGLAGYKDGEALTASLCEPRGLAMKDGALYIADSGNQRIRVYQNNNLTTLAGGGVETYENTAFYAGDWVDGSALEARFNDPQGLSFGEDGALYISDSGNGMIRKYLNNEVTTLVGAGLPVNVTDEAVQNLIAEPNGILALNKELIVTDEFTNRILSIPLIQAKEE